MSFFFHLLIHIIYIYIRSTCKSTSCHQDSAVAQNMVLLRILPWWKKDVMHGHKAIHDKNVNLFSIYLTTPRYYYIWHTGPLKGCEKRKRFWVAREFWCAIASVATGGHSKWRAFHDAGQLVCTVCITQLAVPLHTLTWDCNPLENIVRVVWSSAQSRWNKHDCMGAKKKTHKSSFRFNRDRELPL